MAKRHATGPQVFAQFKGLSLEEQERFVSLAINDFDNAVASLAHDATFSAMDEMKADLDLQLLKVEMARRTRKPNLAEGMRIVRLRDDENLSFGQIGKLVGKGPAAVRQQYHRTKARRSTEP